MKVLWYTNKPFALHNKMLGKEDDKAITGSWLTAAYDSSKSSDVQLYISTVANVSELTKEEENGNFFYLVPHDSSIREQCWRQLKNIASPDVVVIWGTETLYAAEVSSVFKGVPIVVYMQGVMKTIYSHYNDGVPHKYKISTIRDLYEVINPKSLSHLYNKQVAYESMILNNAVAVIVENDWCESVCRCINPKLKVFNVNLPINSIYFDYQWSITKSEKYSLFTNAGGYPIKGHHILFDALGKVKQQIPSIKCYVPGNTLNSYMSIRNRNGYIKYILSIIEKYHLESNIEYVGVLSPVQMASYLTKCRAFVMPSMVENHSSSLIESMIVGTPSITSFVGGVGHYATHMDNAVLYNSLDSDALAGYIQKICMDDEFAKDLSTNAILIRKKRQENFGETMLRVYNKVLEQFD